MKHFTLKFLAILLPVQIAFISILKFFPEFIESFYSQNLFVFISKIQHALLAWIPFSFGDLLYAFVVVFIVIWMFKVIRNRFKRFRLRTLEALAFLSMFYFLFHLFWGLNYYRLPLHENLKIDTTYSKSELVDFTCELIQKTNLAHRELVSHDSIKVDFNFKQKELQDLVFDAYQNFENDNFQFKYERENVKSSLFSLPLSYAGFSGYVNPFTNEAQYNYKIPSYKLPTTIAHEIGHQLGYSKENEANFIASILSIHDENPHVRYSGLTFALKYSLNDIYKTDPELSQALIFDLNPGVKKNYKEVQDFWDKYRGPVELVMEVVYGNYLKVNNQPKGMDSYNYVVALLVNYHKSFNIFE